MKPVVRMKRYVLVALLLGMPCPAGGDTPRSGADADLWARYYSYKRALETRHQPQGLVANACLEEPGGQVREHHFGDATLWTGVWLATLALDYHHRPRKSTLRRIHLTLDALARLEVAQGYLVRTDQGPEAGTELAKPSAGQYVGILLGYDFAYQFVPQAELRRRIRRQTRNAAEYLHSNGFFLTDPWGRLVPRGPSGVAFEYPWRQIFKRVAGRDFPAGHPDPMRFLSRNPDVSFGLMLKLKPYRDRYWFALRNAPALYSRLGRQYSNVHLLFLSALASVGSEEVAFINAFRDFYKGTRKDDPENPLFASIADLILGTHESAAIARKVLRRFPKSLPNSWDDSDFHQDNAWQRNPKRRKEPYRVPRAARDGSCEFSEYPGLDFLFPWMLQNWITEREKGNR